MKIQDNFLPEEVYDQLIDYCIENDFQIVRRGDKEFSVMQIPSYFKAFLQIEDHELILSFIRSAKIDFDNDLRIHADNIIEGKKTALASVLYINPEGTVSPNGTAFWKHHIHGLELPEDVSNEEFDRLLTEDSNDLSKWEHVETVYAKPNRQLVYNSNHFHSKYPKVIEEGTRIVLVCFYAKKQ
ncbi:DUF6445 family protein [Flavobacterium sp. FlaQc-50]|uniref:DUF6445 family protein n=1 Tax=unclassified Flavobacterium TaxID=196869 RepID=UPI003758428C